MKITMQEITEAIAKKAPSDGVWKAEDIAAGIMDLINEEVEQAKADKANWEAGNSEWAVRFRNSGIQAGDPSGATAFQEAAIAKHSAAVEAKLRKNKQVISAIGLAVVGIGTSAIGGAGAATLFPAAMSVATQIASALNDGA